MNIVINGKETEINDSLFSFSEIIKKRDDIKYIQFDFSAINSLQGEMNVLSTCFKETKKELLENG